MCEHCDRPLTRWNRLKAEEVEEISQSMRTLDELAGDNQRFHFHCFWSTDDERETMCWRKPEIEWSERYIDGHTCKKHMLQYDIEELLPIDSTGASTDLCDDCIEVAAYALIEEGVEYFCEEHAFAMGIPSEQQALPPP